MWIARDRNGSLYAYNRKPVRFEDYFGCLTEWGTWDEELGLDKNDYPEVTWENSPKELVVKEESV